MLSGAFLVMLAQSVAEPDSAAPTPTSPACVREWRQPADAPAQVAWCGRAVLAENLLLPEAAPLFATAGRASWEAAVRAAGQARVAGGLGLMGLGVSLSVFIGGLGVLQPLRLPEPVLVAFSLTALSVAFVGSFVAFVIQGLSAHEALAQLEAAVRALP